MGCNFGKKEIKVSVIVPSLNVVNYIEECLDSIIAQSLKELEIICVDAGSEDGTREIILEYVKKDSRVVLLDSPIKSYGFQMNLAIGKAKGQYIGIVESDDYIADNMYEELYKIAENTDVDFVKSAFDQFWDIDNRRKFFPRIEQKTLSILDKVIDLNENRELGVIDINHIWSGIYRKKFLIDKEIKFNETPGASYQDVSFSIIVGLMADSCIYTKDLFYKYRRDNPNSSIRSNKKYKCVIDEFSYISEYVKRKKIDTLENQRYIDCQKFVTYRWNVMRLSEEYQLLFFNEVKDELKEYIENEMKHLGYSDTDIEIVLFLKDIKQINEYNRQIEITRKKVHKLIEDIKAGDKFVIVGAGAYCTQLLWFQEMIGVEYIKAVCDNSEMLQGEQRGKYKICSVEATAKLYRKDKWIIANKKHSIEIYNQLIELGISEQNIVSIKQMIEQDEWLELYLSN